MGRFDPMADDKIYEEPSEVTVEHGVVCVKGPDSVDVKMTPEAADETSERLLYGAMQAMGQRITEVPSEEEQSEGPEAVD
jgi:hypothetical protein